MVGQNEDILIRIKAEIAQAQNNLRKVTRDVNNMARANIRSFERVARAQVQVEKAQERLRKATGNLRIEFQGWALSMMFFGMQLQRTFLGIFRAGQKTFNEIMSSTEGTTTGFQQLEGAMTFLKFVVGQALEPLAFALIPIVDAIAEWVQANPELVRQLTAIGVILGTIFFAGGAGSLAIAGFLELGFKVANLVTKLGGLKAALSGIAAIINAPVALAGMLAVIAAFVAWKEDLWEIRDFLDNIGGTVKETFKGVGKSLKLLFGGFGKLISGLLQGDIPLMVEGFVELLLGALGVILKAIMGVVTLVWNIFVWLGNNIMQWMENLVNSGIEIAIAGLNRVREAQGKSLLNPNDYKVNIFGEGAFLGELPSITVDDLLREFGELDDVTQGILDSLFGTGDGVNASIDPNLIAPGASQLYQVSTPGAGGFTPIIINVNDSIIESEERLQSLFQPVVEDTLLDILARNGG